MIKKINHKNNGGFTLVETVISVVIICMVLLAENTFLFWMFYYNSKDKADRNTLENATQALDTITYEIRGAKSIYTPTTSASQLSLETHRYTLTGETVSYIDFFLCGTRICFKKEGQNAIPLTTDSVEITNLQFDQFMNGTYPSVKVSLTANSFDLSSSVSLRSY
jgi:type II secretory pathway pseudopilin PulG